jgi:GT2 family glycosyltransferase
MATFFCGQALSLTPFAIGFVDVRRPMVGVVVLNWNGWPDTFSCITSLKQIAYDNVFIVVVDNASTDDSVAAIRAEFPEVVLLECESNDGFASGNNVGIRYAVQRGADFVWLLNNDATACTRSLSEMVAVAMQDTSIGAVGSVVFDHDQRDRVQVWGGGRINHWTGSTGPWIKPVPASCLTYLSGVSMLVRSSVWSSVGLLDEQYFMYWEDADFGIRLRRLGWTLAVAPDSHVWHKGSASTGGLNNIDAFGLYAASSIRYFNHHARVPAAPNGIRLLGGVLKWSLRGDWRRLRALIASVSGR